MANNLYPSYVAIDYTTPYAQHRMTLPTLRWNSGGLGLPGTFDTHDAVGIAADEMVEALMDLLAPFYGDTTTFTNYTIFNAPVLSTPLVFNPVFEKFYSVEGSNPTPSGVDKATQYTIGMRTVAYGRSQVVLLDKASGNTWGNVYTMDTPTTNFVAEFSLESNGWAGRDNARPYTFTNISISLNKRLRRKYGMI